MWSKSTTFVSKNYFSLFSMNIYHFSPIEKVALWGSESWQLSGVKGSESRFGDLTLSELIAQERERLVGRSIYERFGNEFPLLIKFIDAHKDLSIQVHPDEETAHRHGFPHGKTEMWYVIRTEEGAHIRAGLSHPITPEEYKQRVADGSICDVISRYDARPGDCFFLPAGRIHSIGAGCFLAEIQQTSDVTYRIFDFNRRDAQGNLRQLHTEQAAESIDYRVLPDYRTHYEAADNRPVPLVSCPYFDTSLFHLTRPLNLDLSRLDTFIVLIGLEGEGTITADGEQHSFVGGQTLLIPAHVQHLHIEGTLRFLQTH